MFDARFKRFKEHILKLIHYMLFYYLSIAKTRRDKVTGHLLCHWGWVTLYIVACLFRDHRLSDTCIVFCIVFPAKTITRNHFNAECKQVSTTLLGPNISHFRKRKIIFRRALGWDMLVPGRVDILGSFYFLTNIMKNWSKLWGIFQLDEYILGCFIYPHLKIMKKLPKVWESHVLRRQEAHDFGGITPLQFRIVRLSWCPEAVGLSNFESFRLLEKLRKFVVVRNGAKKHVFFCSFFGAIVYWILLALTLFFFVSLDIFL